MRGRGDGRLLIILLMAAGVAVIFELLRRAWQIRHEYSPAAILATLATAALIAGMEVLGAYILLEYWEVLD